MLWPECPMSDLIYLLNPPRLFPAESWLLTEFLQGDGDVHLCVSNGKGVTSPEAMLGVIDAD